MQWFVILIALLIGFVALGAVFWLMLFVILACDWWLEVPAHQDKSKGFH